MSNEIDFQAVRGDTMSDAEIDSFLTEQGTGVLALADGNDAYAIPISFGYQEGRIAFVYWQFGTDSRKLVYSKATDRACLSVYDVRSPNDWRSVLVFGPLQEVTTTEWSELAQLMAENAWSPDLSTLENRRLPITGYELTIEEATGLQGETYTTGER